MFTFFATETPATVKQTISLAQQQEQQSVKYIIECQQNKPYSVSEFSKDKWKSDFFENWKTEKLYLRELIREVRTEDRFTRIFKVSRNKESIMSMRGKTTSNDRSLHCFKFHDQAITFALHLSRKWKSLMISFLFRLLFSGWSSRPYPYHALQKSARRQRSVSTQLS